ncbi:MAG: hypothetical protein WBR33_09020, partial [Pseudonocardiaceae bacterium]
MVRDSGSDSAVQPDERPGQRPVAGEGVTSLFNETAQHRDGLWVGGDDPEAVAVGLPPDRGSGGLEAQVALLRSHVDRLEIRLAALEAHEFQRAGDAQSCWRTWALNRSSQAPGSSGRATAIQPGRDCSLDTAADAT